MTFIETLSIFRVEIISTIVAIVVIRVMMKTLRNGLSSWIANQVHLAYTKWGVFHAIGRLFADRKCPKGLPTIEKFEKVSPRCYRVLGLNPGSHTLQGTNTWLIGTGEEKILVDTGEDISKTAYVSLLFDQVFPATGTKRLSSILLSHGHVDHQGGVVAILNELSRRKILPLPKVYKRNIPDGDFPAVGFDCDHVVDGQEFHTYPSHQQTDGKAITPCSTITAVYAPGHTDDHVAFILQEDRALLSGDCILGCGTTVFDKMKPYMDSLQKLRTMALHTPLPSDSNKVSSDALCGTCNNDQMPALPIMHIYPGHGPVIRDEALAKIEEYIEHRRLRESQILAVLRSLSETVNGNNRVPGKEDRSPYVSSWDLVNQIYPKLSLFVKFSAQRNVSHHLEKLLEENVVESKFPDLWRLKI